MTDFSRRVSEYAQDYDPTWDEESAQCAALVQGMLFGSAAHKEGVLHTMMKVESVDQDKDADGNYLPYFTITLASGHRLRVSVEPDN